MTKAELTVQCAKEICDIVTLITNDKDNREEVSQFLSETMEAGMASYQLASKLEGTEYDDAMGVIGAAIGGKIATDRVVFSDGSGIAVTISALDVAGKPTVTELVGGKSPAVESIGE